MSADDNLEHVRFNASLWIWRPDPPAKASWHFVTVTGPAANAIAARAFEMKALGGSRGFGSVRVQARIGKTRFATSVFPSAEQGGYLLPVKASVRKAENIGDGDSVEVELAF